MEKIGKILINRALNTPEVSFEIANTIEHLRRTLMLIDKEEITSTEVISAIAILEVKLSNVIDSRLCTGPTTPVTYMVVDEYKN